MAGLVDGEPKLPLAGPDSGRAGYSIESNTGKTGPVQLGEVVQKKNVIHHPVYFVSSLL